jgi:hypothetical protein
MVWVWVAAGEFLGFAVSCCCHMQLLLLLLLLPQWVKYGWVSGEPTGVRMAKSG